MDYQNKLDEYIDHNFNTYIEQLKRLIRIPSISQMPDKHKNDLYNVLDEVSEILKLYGFENQIVDKPGFPCLISNLEIDKDKPWVTIYNHMDVQPAKEPQWEQKDPFEPIVKSDRIIARGSTDDKGPALSIIHAINFLKVNKLEMPNIQIIYETEEEIGSPNFGKFLEQNKDLIKNSESVLVSDTIFEGDHPAITYKLKGVVRANIYLKTGDNDLHSGMMGGAISNPFNILSHALSTSVDKIGNVTIENFFDNIPKMTQKEKEELQKVAKVFDLDKFHKDSNGAHLNSNKSDEILEKLWYKPTFEVHGFAGGQSEEYNENNDLKRTNIKTAIPYEALAKITMRLVSGISKEEAIEKLEKHLKKVNSNFIVESYGGAEAFGTEIDNSFMEKARNACNIGFGKKALFVGSGGTIGAVPQFQKFFSNKPIVLIAQSLMSDNYHGPNENFKFEQARKGIKTISNYLNEIANERS